MSRRIGAIGLAGLILVILGAASASAVTFSNADMQGAWVIQGFGASEALGVKYTGRVTFDAEGNVTGGTINPDWETGYTNGGHISVDGAGMVQGLITGLAQGPAHIVIKRGVMDLAKKQITVMASGERSYNLFVIMIKVEETIGFEAIDVDRMWTYAGLGYYDVHDDYAFGQFQVSGGILSNGTGAHHTEPCTFTGTIGVAGNGNVSGDVNGFWVEEREDIPDIIYNFAWKVASAQMTGDKGTIVGTGTVDLKVFSLMFFTAVNPAQVFSTADLAGQWYFFIFGAYDNYIDVADALLTFGEDGVMLPCAGHYQDYDTTYTEGAFTVLPNGQVSGSVQTDLVLWKTDLAWMNETKTKIMGLGWGLKSAVLYCMIKVGGEPAPVP